MTLQSEQLPSQDLTKRERRLLRRKEREAERERLKKARSIKRVMSYALVIVVVSILGWLIVKGIASSPPLSSEEILSRNGLHWHAKLRIIINGKEEAVNSNIGIGIRHNPLHTHEPDNVIHMEFQGLVTVDDLKLGKFFNVWGKQFSSSCIFDFCSGPNGTLRMTVNGKENTEFEEYVMQDKDKIVITYEENKN